MIITSKSNKIVNYIASLKTKKYRRVYGAYVVEGKKMVAEAFAAGKTVEIVVLSESMSETGLSFPCDDIVIVSDSVFAYLSDEVTPQGVMAVLKVENVAVKKSRGVCVLLDGISDPGNLGTIFRTTAALGVDALYLVNCCDPYSPKTVRASMSGIYHVNFYECDYAEALTAIEGIPVYICDMGGENVFSFDPADNYCVVIGNEANGVGEIMRSRADGIIGIPMSKNSESLNAAVSLAVVLYALTEGKGKTLIK